MEITGDYADDDLLTSGQVKEVLGVSPSTVAHHTRSGALKSEPRSDRFYRYKWRNVKAFAARYVKQPTYSAAFLANVPTLYTDGMSIRQIAQAKNVPYGTIRNYLIDKEVPLRGKGAAGRMPPYRHR